MDEKYLYSITRQDLINRIDVALAGRAAEEIIFGYDELSIHTNVKFDKTNENWSSHHSLLFEEVVMV